MRFRSLLADLTEEVSALLFLRTPPRTFKKSPRKSVSHPFLSENQYSILSYAICRYCRFVGLNRQYRQKRQCLFPKRKEGAISGSFFFCGERGIRTPGASQLNGFQDRRNRPLCHLSSKSVAKVLLFF